MPRRIATAFTRHPITIAVLGDSYTFNTDYMTVTSEYFGPRLAVAMTAAGTPAICRLLGISGDSTRATSLPTIGFLSRIAPVIQEPLPKLAIVYGSTNDAGQAANFTPPTTATDFWEDETLPNLINIGTQLLDAGIQYLVIPGLHLYNWASGTTESGVTGAGGSVRAEAPLTAPGTTMGSRLRHAQYSAVQALLATYPGRVAFCDFYAYMATFLNANPTQIGVDLYWHVAAGDTHLNAVGEQLLADALLVTINAQSGWINYLQH